MKLRRLTYAYTKTWRADSILYCCNTYPFIYFILAASYIVEGWPSVGVVHFYHYTLQHCLMVRPYAPTIFMDGLSTFTLYYFISFNASCCICIYSVQLVAEAHLILHMIHLTAMCYILLMHNCNLIILFSWPYSNPNKGDKIYEKSYVTFHEMT